MKTYEVRPKEGGGSVMRATITTVPAPSVSATLEITRHVDWVGGIFMNWDGCMELTLPPLHVCEHIEYRTRMKAIDSIMAHMAKAMLEDSSMPEELEEYIKAAEDNGLVLVEVQG